MKASDVYVGLAHYPVVNKKGSIITSAVTNLDLHDIARVSKTFGIRSFIVITPLHDQKVLVKKIVNHWVHGAGAAYNPKRQEALKLIHIEDTLESAQNYIRNQGSVRLITVVTTSRRNRECLKIDKFRTMIETGNPILLLFGTAWGLTKECISKADYVLEPIDGCGEYNHLSVRSAAAIILDRLLGRKKYK